MAESLLGGERRENSDSEDEPLICDGSPYMSKIASTFYFKVKVQGPGWGGQISVLFCHLPLTCGNEIRCGIHSFDTCGVCCVV